MALQAMRVPTVFTAVDKFSDVVNKMTRNTDAFSRSSAAAADRVSRKMTTIGKGMIATSAAMLASLAYPLNKAVEFEDQIASIATLLPELNSKGIKQIGDDIIEMATKTSIPIEELTKSYYDLISAGVANKDAMAWLKSGNKLAIAGLGTLVESTNIELAAMRNFSKDFKNTDEAANALFKTVKYGKTTVAQLSEAFAANAVFAGGLGVTGQEYMASIAAITTSTLPTSMAEVAIGSLSNAISKTTEKKNKILFSLFKRMNVKSGEELLQKKGGFLPALMAIKDEAGKAGLKMESIFGLKQASTAFIMLTKNQKVLEKYAESFKSISDKNEDALSTAFIKKQATGKFGIGVLTNNLNAMAITVGTALIPALLELTKYLNPLLKRFSAFIKNNPGAVTGFLKIALAIGAIGTALTVGGWMLKLYTFFAWLRNLAWVTAWIEGIGVAFSMAAGEIVASGILDAILAVVEPLAIIFAGIWVMLDMIQHWKDWKEIVALCIGPLGWVVLLLSKIDEHSSNIRNSFAFEGWDGGIRSIGTLLEDLILSPLIGALRIMGRLTSFVPGLGSSLTEMANDLESVRTKIPTGTSIGNLGMQGASNFTTFGGIMPQWDTFKKENLAGNNTGLAQEIAKAMGLQTMDINVNDPNSVLSSVILNGKKYPNGLGAKTGSTTGVPSN